MVLLLLLFPSDSVLNNPPAMEEMQEMWVRSLGREYTLEEAWQPTPVTLHWEYQGQRSLVGYSL